MKTQKWLVVETYGEPEYPCIRKPYIMLAKSKQEALDKSRNKARKDMLNWNVYPQGTIK